MWTLMVTGGRTWKDVSPINWNMAQLWKAAGSPAECTLIHGDARGADRIAATIAAERGWVVRSYPADWDNLGKVAGMVRNIQMLDSKPDHVLGCMLTGSIGTHHALLHAQLVGIPRTVIFG